jgi:hypothetical protein
MDVGSSGGGIGVASPTITITIFSNEYFADVTNNYVVSPSTPLTDTITYTPISNSVRYGDVTDTTSRTSVVITKYPFPSFSMSSNVYPDTTYKIQLSSSNGTNSTPLPLPEITAAPTPGIDITALKLSYITSSSTGNAFTLFTLPTNVSAKPVAGGSSVTVITDNAIDISGIATFRVHNSFVNRGVNVNAQILNISSSILTGTTTTDTSSPAFTLNNVWSGATNNWVNTNTNITVAPGSFTSLESGALSGYYATCPITTTVKTSNYLTSARTNAYTITTKGTYPGNLDYSFTSSAFYYDGPVPTPTCAINSLTINTTPIQISGITLYNDDISVTPTITVGNIGTHFYNATRTVAYSGSIGETIANNTTETGLPNGYTSSTKSGTFNTPLTFTKIPVIYSKSLSLTATAYNISGIGQASTIYSTKIIYDTNSVVPITSPNSIGIGANAVGCRLWSVYSISSSANSIGNENATPNNNGKNLTFYNGTSYTSFSMKKIDNTISLVDNAKNYQYELLYASGKYTTTTEYALDYNLYGGLYDYTTIQNTTLNGNKYATFMWTFSPQSSTINSVNFTFNNTNYTPTLSGTADKVNINGSQMQLYYRLENQSLPTGSTIDVSTALNTPLINGTNASGGTYFTSNNISGSSATTLVYRGLNSLTSSTFNCALVPLTSTNFSSGTLNLYCRIAIPVSSGFMFSSISASLSS